MNDRVYHHDKWVQHYCLKCGKVQRKLLGIECTQHKRQNTYCDACKGILAEVSGIDVLADKAYTGDILIKNEKKKMGQPIKRDKQKAVKQYRAMGLSYRDIARIFYCKKNKITGDIKQIHRWDKYADK